MRVAGGWIHSRRFDLTFFIGPAVVALLLIAPALAGTELPELSPLGWLLLVLMVDVAHVWSSLFRVYLDPRERRRRPWLYFGTPLAVWLGGTIIYGTEPAWFWTGLAYIAVHHFVRQQIGFVALYRAAAGDRRPISRHLDHLAVYTGTLVPIAWWHVHLPRSIAWFMPGDFVGPWAADVMLVLWPLYWLVAAAWLAHLVRSTVQGTPIGWGRVLTMLATWTMWGVGIVVLDSDYAFTATNVLLHGIPYLALVWLAAQSGGVSRKLVGALPFLIVVMVCAVTEEWLWDATVWREHAMIFGDWTAVVSQADWVEVLFVPLLTVPQATHYVLDGFIWRMDGSNPGLKQRVLGS
ncbi:MAG: hypothetical protein ACI9WU_000100 [Myxococcota bacterium]|jgi:hypothetical protein